MEPNSYGWLWILGLIVSFTDGFGIGANDMANSFANSVGSKTITLKQACSIAVFTELGGAVLFGSRTLETVRDNILKPEYFKDKPECLMLGMVCALFGSSFWTIYASSKGWPVSTTHSIVGAIIGIGLVTFGPKSIDWSTNGVLKIVASWLVSPLVSGLMASGVFLLTKYFVLSHKDTSFQRGLVAVPIYFGLTIAINILFLVVNGVASLNLDKIPAQVIGPIVVGATLVVAAYSYFFYAQWLRRKILGRERNLKWYHIFIIPFIGARYHEGDGTETGGQSSNITDKTSIYSSSNDDLSIRSVESGRKDNIFKVFLNKLSRAIQYGVEQEVAEYEASVHREMHNAATKYDKDTEELYSFLQVITGAFASFSHGSNDVSNAIAPLATIYLIYTTNVVDSTNTVPSWFLVFGGAAIDAGLLFYGYHVMRSLGSRFTYHSPSRGFSMELGTSLTVLAASKIGLPISTTYCITGATAGVALCNGRLKALNWKLLMYSFFSWVITLPVAAGVSGALYAFAVYSPKLV